MLLTATNFFGLSNVNAQKNIIEIGKLTNQGITLAKSGTIQGQ